MNTLGSWTDERVEALKKHWAEGFSASQIAQLLGGVTRNAVIGKVNRLGLEGRARASRPGAVRTPKPARPRQPRPFNGIYSGHPATPPLAKKLEAIAANEAARRDHVEPLIEGPGLATVLTLGAHMCRWPIGDPALDNFTHCGRRKLDGKPYCREHAAVAYQPMTPKKSGHELARSLRRYL